MNGNIIIHTRAVCVFRFGRWTRIRFLTETPPLHTHLSPLAVPTLPLNALLAANEKKKNTRKHDIAIIPAIMG